MNILRHGLLGVALCLAWAAATAATDPVAALIARHGLRESAAPVRDNPLWRKPRKIVLLPPGVSRERLDSLRATADGAQLVVARNVPEAAQLARDADVVIGFNPAICDPDIIDGARQLRWLVSLSAGVEHCMDLPAVKARRVMMTNMRGVDSPVIAEHAIALMLALAHGLDRFAIDTEHKVWSRASAATVPTQFMEGKTMLVSGLGGIGTEVARRANGLGMRVVATRVGGGPQPEFVSYIGQPDELLALAKTADVVVSAVPLTPATTNLYDAKFFAVLKPTAFFINVARGGSVDTDALTAALNEHRLAGAGLDVVEPEPLPPDNPLWNAPRILLTPHISGRSDLPGDDRWTVLAENLRRYMAGGKLLNMVDLARGY